MHSTTSCTVQLRAGQATTLHIRIFSVQASTRLA